MLIGFVVNAPFAYVLIADCINSLIEPRLADDGLQDSLDSVKFLVYRKPLAISLYLFGWTFIPKFSVLEFRLAKKLVSQVQNPILCRQKSTQSMAPLL